MIDEATKTRLVIDDGVPTPVEYYSFVDLPDLSDLTGLKSDETLLMGIS